MGFLKRLTPWYNWSDRWAPVVFTIPTGKPSQVSTFTFPEGYRYEVLSIQGKLVSSAAAGNRFVEFRLCRGGVTLTYTTSNLYQAPNNTIRWIFAKGLFVTTISAANYTQKWPLPDSFYAMPFDYLEFQVWNGSALDLLSGWTMYCKRWED